MQLQYYRRIQNIRVKDMAKVLNIGYNTIWRIEEKSDENYNLNHKNIEIINKIIDYLNIRNKIDFSKFEYIDFILNKQVSILIELRKLYKRKELANILDVTPDTITRWIDGKIVISKENYFKIKKMLEIK